jgi:hypothetical protein
VFVQQQVHGKEGDNTQRDGGELRSRLEGSEAPREEVSKPMIDIAATLHQQASAPEHSIIAAPLANQLERGGETIEHHVVLVFLELPEAEKTKGRS